MRIIDFHTHFAQHWFQSPLQSEPNFMGTMDRLGIGISCIFTLMGFYEPCPPHNDFLAAGAARHPQRLVPFITVDPKLGKPAIEELERCLANPLFRGVKFHPWCQAFAPSIVKTTMVEILKIAARHDLPVLFHDGTPPYSTTFQIAETARWVPECKVVLGHSGLADYVVAAGQLAREIPNLYACLCGPKVSDLRYLADTAGAEKVLWGSDGGLDEWQLVAERMDDATQAGLDADTLDQVLYRTAAGLLHLDQRPLSHG